MKKICVVGSINMDYITITDRVPQKGETLFGKNFSIQPGGKGANQAIAAAKLGANVTFIGACGNDSIYDDQVENFKKYGVDIRGVEKLNRISSGIAQITISNGDNSIIVVSGANSKVDKQLIDRNFNLIEEADIILLQYEIPVETVEYIVDKAHELNKIIVLNPAPSHPTSEKILKKVTYLIPNEIEIAQMFSEDYEMVLKRYPNKVIMTKGKDGVYYHDGTNIVHIEALKGNSIDSTGAGDTFNGAFVTAISEGLDLKEAVEFANLAAFKSIQKVGAQSAMPTRKEMK